MTLHYNTFQYILMGGWMITVKAPQARWVGKAREVRTPQSRLVEQSGANEQPHGRFKRQVVLWTMRRQGGQP